MNITFAQLVVMFWMQDQVTSRDIVISAAKKSILKGSNGKKKLGVCGEEGRA